MLYGINHCIIYNLLMCPLFFRDVSSVELLMNNHQGIKAEIDARNDSFTACIELGKSLLARKHYASEEVSETLTSAQELQKKWDYHSLEELSTIISLLILNACFPPPQIKEKLLQLTDKRKDMIDKWEDRWEWLRLSK